MVVKSGHPIEHRRKLNVFVLALLCLAVVISLRNLPLSAEYGISALFYYGVAAIIFMIPYALVSAELASGWPKSGGVYIWVREALGERWGFFAIWMQWFHNMTWYPAMLAFVGAGIAHIFDPFLATNKTYLISVILIGFWGVTFLNFLGIQTSAWISSACVIVGVLIPGAILITLGALWILDGHPLNISLAPSHLIPDLTHPSNLVFLSGVFLALVGLEVNANLAREIKHPQKNYPRAMLIAIILALTILILGAISIAIVIPKEQIDLVSGVFEAFRYFLVQNNLRWAIPLIFGCIILGAIGELNAWAIASVKGLFVTTEHGSLPPIFHKVNKNHVPVNLLIFQALVVTATSFIFLYLPNINISYWVLSAFSVQMYLLMYLLLLISGIVLRYKKPNVHRVYKVPFKNGGMWVAAIVGIAASLFALVLSFFPPEGFEVGNIYTYEILLFSGFIISCLIPLVIVSFREPEWQTDVLKEIREEIHRSTH